MGVVRLVVMLVVFLPVGVVRLPVRIFLPVGVVMLLMTRLVMRVPVLLKLSTTKV